MTARPAPGYWEPDGRITLHRDGFYRSGDLFRRTGDVLRFVARAKDIIVRGGSNISPAEVEHAIMSSLDVAHVQSSVSPTRSWGGG